jgi:hypothetical protein
LPDCRPAPDCRGRYEVATGYGRRVRVVGEVDFSGTSRDRLEWQRYEAVINRSLATLPLWIPPTT